MADASWDVLLLLRQALSSSPDAAQIEFRRVDGSRADSLLDATSVALPSQQHDGTVTHKTFDRSTPTRYTKGAAGTGDGSAESVYDLQTLVYAYLERDASVPDYLKQAQELGVPIVSITDRRQVVDWLSGKTPLDGTAGRILPFGQSHTGSKSNNAPGPAIISQLGSDTDSATKRTADDLDSTSRLQSSTATATLPTATDTSGTTSVKRKRYVPDKADQETVKRILDAINGPAYAVDAPPGQNVKADRPNWAIRDRETALMGSRINNFESVRALVAPRLNLTRDEQEQKSSSTATKDTREATLATPSSGAKPSKRKNQDPIIMISPSSTALITMHNVKRFLEDAVFEHSEQARTQGGGATGDVIPVTRIRPATSVASSFGQAPVRKSRYFIVDGVEALAKFGGDNAWDRVVCVMTTGQEWQFRPYKWKEPKELFHHVKGIFVQWTTDAPNPKVRNWNVTELRIDPSKRHIDKSTVADFWRSLEAWMAQHKPHMMT
ncbi:accessory factor associated with RNA polymerase II [Microbotryomycetes sp. JL221]|nr:accessory factor associated with RNA polymerase II [Microbotryomycetes sp. JL221]